MSPLEKEQKQLLFDYCMGLTSEKEAGKAQQLILSNREAAEIHSKLKAALEPLDNTEPDLCPEDLAERTVVRLNNIARSSQLQLQQLLADEQAKDETTKSSLWLNFKRLATAAVILFIAGVLIPTWRITSNYARQNYWQKSCQAQLGQIGRGISQYSCDYEGKLPVVATAAGEPWWKVGHPGKKNHSNTRHMWLLVKKGYVDPANFVCPGRKQGRAIQINLSQVKNYHDFPGRKYVGYSFRVRCNKPGKRQAPSQKVLIADLSPLFEKLPQYSNPLKLQVTKDLLTRNSINHRRRGQNVMFGDQSVRFVKRRCVGVAEDDIFTLRDIQVYKGCELPSCETDAFLAP